MLILLSTVYGSFHATTAKLHSCNKDLWPAKLKTFLKYLAHGRKYSPTPNFKRNGVKSKT